jgi:hypothetical protein
MNRSRSEIRRKTIGRVAKRETRVLAVHARNAVGLSSMASPVVIGLSEPEEFRFTHFPTLELESKYNGNSHLDLIAKERSLSWRKPSDFLNAAAPLRWIAGCGIPSTLLTRSRQSSAGSKHAGSSKAPIEHILNRRKSYGD